MAPRSRPTPEAWPTDSLEVAVDMRSLARSGHETNTRAARGRRLFADHGDEIMFLENDVWRCPSANGSRASHYLVNLREGTCECADFEYRHLPCKHLEAVSLKSNEAALHIDYPVEEELLAACEYVLDWFEQWEEHAEHENDFGGEHACMLRLRRAVQLARA